MPDYGGVWGTEGEKKRILQDNIRNGQQWETKGIKYILYVPVIDSERT